MSRTSWTMRCEDTRPTGFRCRCRSIDIRVNDNILQAAQPDLNVIPPLDVHWVWHTHMLSPIHYQEVRLFWNSSGLRHLRNATSITYQRVTRDWVWLRRRRFVWHWKMRLFGEKRVWAHLQVITAKVLLPAKGCFPSDGLNSTSGMFEFAFRFPYMQFRDQNQILPPISVSFRQSASAFSWIRVYDDSQLTLTRKRTRMAVILFSRTLTDRFSALDFSVFSFVRLNGLQQTTLEQSVVFGCACLCEDGFTGTFGGSCSMSKPALNRGGHLRFYSWSVGMSGAKHKLPTCLPLFPLGAYACALGTVGATLVMFIHKHNILTRGALKENKICAWLGTGANWPD